MLVCFATQHLFTDALSWLEDLHWEKLKQLKQVVSRWRATGSMLMRQRSRVSKWASLLTPLCFVVFFFLQKIMNYSSSIVSCRSVLHHWESHNVLPCHLHVSTKKWMVSKFDWTVYAVQSIYIPALQIPDTEHVSVFASTQPLQSQTSAETPFSLWYILLVSLSSRLEALSVSSRLIPSFHKL